MRSSNPALQDNTFTGFGYGSGADTMTVQGVVAKTGIMLLLVMLSAGWTWTRFFQSGMMVEAVYPWMMVGIIGGLILAFTTIFKPVWASFTAPAYALLEGLFIGGMSSVLEASFPGIVIQAAGLTFGTLAAMLCLYASGYVRATEKFRVGVMAATGGIFLFYMLSWILSFFGVQMSIIYGNGLMGIGFSLVVVVVAALNFILDFDFIEQGEKRGAPKYMEWYGSFALMVTLIWLYIEFLRLLSKLRSR